MEYRAINYFDVWGNEEEGYNVNDSCEESVRMFISDNMGDSDIVQMMVELGYLKDTAVLGENVFITSTGDGYELEGTGGYPLFGFVPCNC
jgi:hypothetical protein